MKRSRRRQCETPCTVDVELWTRAVRISQVTKSSAWQADSSGSTAEPGIIFSLYSGFTTTSTSNSQFKLALVQLTCQYVMRNHLKKSIIFFKQRSVLRDFQKKSENILWLNRSQNRHHCPDRWSGSFYSEIKRTPVYWCPRVQDSLLRLWYKIVTAWS